MHTTLRRSYLLSKGGVPVLLLVGLIVGGCGSFQLQQPENQQLALSAQTHFQNAGLSQSIVAERERLASVLEQELDLVARHTLARRDARLLFLISVGSDSVITDEGAISPWQWLKHSPALRKAPPPRLSTPSVATTQKCSVSGISRNTSNS